jgi:hypothetical protein
MDGSGVIRSGGDREPDQDRVLHAVRPCGGEAGLAAAGRQLTGAMVNCGELLVATTVVPGEVRTVC